MSWINFADQYQRPPAFVHDWFVHIRKTEYASLQTQIREALVSAILDGGLARSEPVPSTRRMARTLGVSRNTVMLAYQGLLDDGYLIARERSGYYVSEKTLGASPQYKLPLPRPKLAPVRRASDHSSLWESRLRLRPAGLESITKPLDWMNYRYPFINGQLDHKLFPIAEWRDCSRQALGRRSLDAWANNTWAFDDPLLVEQIRRRILPRRGIMASDSQILVTLGAQNALFLLASLLVRQGTHAVMEEPGFPDMRNLFVLSGARLSLVPVDDRGLDPAGIPGQPDVVFTTPSHQFPTTATMPLERQLALLAAAAERDFVIIEDDYEFDTHYVSESCPALKSLDEEGRVVYVGSLSKTLFPGLRLGFLVGPERLIEEARALRRLMLRHAPNNNQRAAALFLSLGHHDSLIHKLSRVYRTRWEAIGAALGRHLPGSAAIPSFGGTSVWVRGPDGLDGDRLAAEAAERGVLIEPGRIYFGAAAPPCNFFRLGFSSIDVSRIEPGIRRLAEIVAGTSPRAGD